MIWYGMVRCGAVECGAVRCGVVRCGAVWYGMRMVLLYRGMDGMHGIVGHGTWYGTQYNAP